MRRGVVLSAVLHVAVFVLAYFRLWDVLFPSPPMEETPIAVELVTIAPETRATRPNQTPPKPAAKPEEQVVQAAPEPPKKEPPKPEPAPPAPPPQPAPPAPPPPQPAPPKPPEPKPEPPPPPVPKPEPPPPPPPPPKPPQEARKKQEDLAFDALLKNLAKRAEAPPPDDAPKPRAQPQPAPPSSQPIAPLGSQLTTSERDLVIQQIEQCWNVPAGAKDARDLIVEIHVEMNPDATVREAHITSTRRMTDTFYEAAAESALRAVLNPRCQPFKLPPEKYDQWQTMSLRFNPKDIL